VIVRLGIKTLHRCQVVALDWSRFDPSIRLLMAVKLMDLIVPPWLNRRDTTILLKEGPATLVNKVPFFSPDLRSLRHFYRIPSHLVSTLPHGHAGLQRHSTRTPRGPTWPPATWSSDHPRG
jgi:hypothetical protein